MAAISKPIFIWPQTETDLLSGGTCYASKAEAFVRTSNRFWVIKQQPKEKDGAKRNEGKDKKKEAIKMPLKAVPPPIPVTPPNICNLE